MSSVEVEVGYDYVRIFDTTCRDGEQSPGATMTRSEKLRFVKDLESLGVDVIEAGFPAASPGEVSAVREISAFVSSDSLFFRSRGISC